ncbi:MAG: TonB-dependent receptor plug domain-containing protein [Pseudomonadota bacterium]
MLACTGVAQAQTTGDPADTTLPAVKVKAQSVKPAEVVDAKALGDTQAKDAREALQSVPGVAVGGGGNAIAQKIYVRGLEDTLLGVTLDGAPQGGYLYHHQGRVLVDPALLKSVQVQKGVASASAGPGTLAGAINITTQDAADLLAPGQTVGGRLGLGGFSNKGWKASASGYGQSADKAFDGLVSVTRQDIDECQDGKGQSVIHSGSTQDAALAKLNWQPLPGHRLSLGLNHFNDEGVRFLRPNMVDFARSGAPMPQTYRRDQLTLGYRSAGGGGTPAIEATLFGDDNRNERTVTATGRTYGERVEGRGLNASAAQRFAEHRLKVGINHHAYEARALNPANVGTGPYGNGRETASVTGVFAEDSVALAPQWQLSAGLRVDSYRYHDDHDQRFSSTGASPSLGLQYLASDALTLHASAGSTVRGAGLKESFLLDNGPGYRNVAGLQAERSRNLAVGFDAALGAVTLRGEVFQQKIGRYITTGFDADDNAIRHPPASEYLSPR